MDAAARFAGLRLRGTFELLGNPDRDVFDVAQSAVQDDGITPQTIEIGVQVDFRVRRGKALGVIHCLHSWISKLFNKFDALGVLSAEKFSGAMGA